MARRTGGRLRAALFLALSILAGTAASIVVGITLASLHHALESARHSQPAMVRIPVAAHPIPRGEVLLPEDLAMRELPADYVSENVAFVPEELVGRVPRERLLPGEPVRLERLAAPGQDEGLATLVPRGMRAVSVVLDDDDRVSGFLEPGNRVDLIVSTEGRGAGEAQTTTLLDAVEVVAVTPSDQQRGAPQVVLQATPDDVERVAHAVEEGRVKLTLRSDIDLLPTPEVVLPVTTAALLGTEATRLDLTTWRELRARDPHLVTVIHGPEVVREAAGDRRR